MNMTRTIFLQGVKYILAVVLTSVFVIVIVEGLSSTTIAVFQMLRDPPLSSRSRYDKALASCVRIVVASNIQ